MTQARPFLAFLLLILASLSASAQQPSFPIERIDVRGARFASDDVVARESLLTTGSTYSEADLRRAMSRINRLPFVLDSTFAIEKGTTRGSYVLVITIVETKPVFVEALGLTDLSSSSTRTASFFRTGARWFLGSSSLVHAATDFENNYEAGITQYDLFGRPGFISLNVRWTSDNEGTITLPSGDQQTVIEYSTDLSPELRFGLPVFGDHSIVGRWERRGYDTTMTTQSLSRRSRSTNDYGELAWAFDTTDDPILPTAGTLWQTGVRFQIGGSKESMDGVETDFDSQMLGLFSGLAHHRPVNEWVSLSYGLEVGGGRTELDLQQPLIPGEPPLFSRSVIDAYYLAPEIGLSASLWPDRLTRRLGDLRLETRARYAKTFYEESFRKQDGSLIFDAAIVQRNVWGTLRLVFGYTSEND